MSYYSSSLLGTSLTTHDDDDGDDLADLPAALVDDDEVPAFTPTSTLSTNFSIESPSVTSRGGNPKDDSWNRVTGSSQYKSAHDRI